MRHLPILEENFRFCPENPICEILCILFYTRENGPRRRKIYFFGQPIIFSFPHDSVGFDEGVKKSI